MSKNHNFQSMRDLMISTAIGNISGKPYESRRTRTKDYDSFDLLLPENSYSEDTVCTFACADALLNQEDVAKLTDECIRLATETGLPTHDPSLRQFVELCSK